MAQFEKGNTMSKGRPKGSENRISKEIRKVLKAHFDNEIDYIFSNLDKLDFQQRVNFFIKIAPFVLPKINTIYMQDGEKGFL